MTMTWQPIETAPKDGTRIILWLPKTPHQKERWVVSFWQKGFAFSYWSNEYGNGPMYNKCYVRAGDGYVVEYKQIEPSHWMREPTEPQP